MRRPRYGAPKTVTLGPSARAGRRVISAGARAFLKDAHRCSSRTRCPCSAAFRQNHAPALDDWSRASLQSNNALDPTAALSRRCAPPSWASAGQRGYVRQKGLWQPLASPASSRVAIGLIPALATSLRELSLALPAARWPSDCSRARQPLPSRRRFKIIAKGPAPESCQAGCAQDPGAAIPHGAMAPVAQQGVATVNALGRASRSLSTLQ